MKTWLLIIFPAIFLATCNNDSDQADAYGSFEAVEVMVSAETSGRIIEFEAIIAAVFTGFAIRRYRKTA